MKAFKVVSVNISREKATPKTPVDRIECRREHGVVGDAHAGPGARQVSLLAMEDVETMPLAGAPPGPGAFAENITTRGIDLAALPVTTRLRVGTAELEVTQIGKECHGECAVMRQLGTCIMPRRGIFARVVRGGEIGCEDTGSYGF